MKLTSFLLALAAPLMAQTTINVSTTLTPEHTWALNQDYAEYSADTNNPAVSRADWERAWATKAVTDAADRRLKDQRQRMHSIIVEKWARLTPEEMTNVVKALPEGKVMAPRMGPSR